MPAAREWLADKGYDPAYGARPLKRVIQKAVQDPLAELILSGKIKDGEKVDGLRRQAGTDLQRARSPRRRNRPVHCGPARNSHAHGHARRGSPMSYVNSVLQPGEHIVAIGRLHWIVYWLAILSLVSV